MKLASTKARNGKTTLLHYLIKVLEDKMPDVLDVWADLKALEPTSRVTLSDLGGELSALQKGLEAVEKELHAAAAETDARSLHFCHLARAFLSAAQVNEPCATPLSMLRSRESFYTPGSSCACTS